MHRVLPTTIIVLSVVLAACGSGPSPQALERDRLPQAPTTTEAPPEGTILVIISNGRFAPSNLALDLDTHWIVRWENRDPPREYVIFERNDLFESEILEPGDAYEIDFSELPPGLYRYYTELGAQRIPGLVDTRPSR